MKSEAVNALIREFVKRGWGVEDIHVWLIVNLGIDADRQTIRDMVWGVSK